MAEVLNGLLCDHLGDIYIDIDRYLYLSIYIYYIYL